MRTADIERNTSETEIALSLNLDGTGIAEIDSGIGFLDHMLTLFARHGRIDLKLSCKGDTLVDDHHSTEDIAICLGLAFREALGDKRGICRYGDAVIPMDESLILSAVDISGRGRLEWAVELPAQKVGTFDTELAEDFFEAFACNAGITLHLRMLSGRNTHHILEACFKSAARSLRQAVKADLDCEGEVPSTKGVL